MNSFKDLQSQWQKQPATVPTKEQLDAVLQRIKEIKSKQGITNMVLIATVFILLTFFFYVEAYRNTKVGLDLSLMIFSLIIRIGIELMSIRKLKGMDILMDSAAYTKQLVTYYNKRKMVHYFITPVIVICYCIGFVRLLPVFKKNLSTGFYNYIVISSIVVLIVLGTFIAIQIKKELVKLRELQRLKIKDD